MLKFIKVNAGTSRTKKGRQTRFDNSSCTFGVLNLSAHMDHVDQIINDNPLEFTKEDFRTRHVFEEPNEPVPKMISRPSGTLLNQEHVQLLTAGPQC